MADKRRILDLVLDGRLSGRFPSVFGRADKALNKYGELIDSVGKKERSSKLGAVLSGKAMSGLVKGGLAAGAAYLSFDMLKSAYAAVTSEANEAINANTRLNKLLLNTQGNRLSDVHAIQAQSQAIERKTTLDGDALTMGASQLATFQLQGKTVKTLMGSMADLMVNQKGVNATGEDAFQIANLMGKVMSGNAGALTKYGVSMTTAQKKIIKSGTESQRAAMLVKVLNQNVGGLAEKMRQTPEGRLAAMNVAWGNIKETLGRGLLPIQEKVIMRLSGKLPLINSLIDKFGAKIPAISSGIGKGFAAAYKILKPVIDWIINKALPFLGKVGADIIKIFQNAWPAIQPSLQKLTSSIGNLLNKVMPILQGIWAIAKPILDYVIRVVLPMVIRLVTSIIDKIAVMVDKIAEGFRWWQAFTGARNAKTKEEKMSAYADWYVKYGNHSIRKRTEAQAAAQAKMTAGKRAAGGPVSAGRSYIVGERGPELFTPRRGGQIVPNMALAGAGITVNNYVTVSGNANRSDIDGALQMSERRLETMIERILRNRQRRSFA